MVRKRSRARAKSIKNKQLIGEMAFFLLSLVLFCCVLHASSRYVRPINIESLELIERSKQPMKVQPKELSGLIIPHQNKKIYTNFKVAPPKSTEYKDLSKAAPKAHSVLMKIRDQHLGKKSKSAPESVKDPFSVIECDDNKKALMSFGITSTRAAGITRTQKLSKQYHELQSMKFVVIETGSNQYEIRSANAVNLLMAQTICAKIKKNQEVCHVRSVE